MPVWPVALASMVDAGGLRLHSRTGGLGPPVCVWMALQLCLLLFLATPSQAAGLLLGMRFVDIPAGRFIMGSCILSNEDKVENTRRALLGMAPVRASCLPGTTVDADAAHDESPQHWVRIANGFQLARYEVTLGQFRRFIDATGRSNYLTDDFLEANRYGDDVPVVMVSWEQAMAFIAWLNDMDSAYRYRLPSEAEWEYAARAGSNTHWSFHGRYRDYAWYASNSDGHPHPVGKKRPNAWGLYDMHGNVWEWTADWYDAQFYARSPKRDPARLRAGTYRVVRGGSFEHSASDLRSANRGNALPDQGYAFVGFRLLRTPRHDPYACVGE